MESQTLTIAGVPYAAMKEAWIEPVTSAALSPARAAEPTALWPLLLLSQL